MSVRFQRTSSSGPESELGSWKTWSTGDQIWDILKKYVKRNKRGMIPLIFLCCAHARLMLVVPSTVSCLWALLPKSLPVCFPSRHLQHYANKTNHFPSKVLGCLPWCRRWSQSALRTVCGCSPPSTRSDHPGRPRTAGVEVPAHTDTRNSAGELSSGSDCDTVTPLSDLWGAFGGGVETRAAKEKIDLLPGLTTGFLKMKETLNLWISSGLQQVLHRT